MQQQSDSLNILTLLIFMSFAFLGAIIHWAKKKLRGDIRGNLIDYLFADHPGGTGQMAAFIVFAAWGAASTGALDGLNWDVTMAYLKVWNIPWPTIHVLAGAITIGWAADSGLNKGIKP